MEGSCGQFRSDKTVNFNDVYWRQNYENVGRHNTTKVSDYYRRGYHGGGENWLSPSRTVGGSAYRPYYTLPNHQCTPISISNQNPYTVNQPPIYGCQAMSYYPYVESYNQTGDFKAQTAHVPVTAPRFYNTARRLDLGHVTDRPHHVTTTVNYPRDHLKSYRTRDPRIRAWEERGQTAGKRHTAQSCQTQSSDVLNAQQKTKKRQRACPEALPLDENKSHCVLKKEERKCFIAKKNIVCGNEPRKLGTKRTRPVSASPTISPVCKKATKNPAADDSLKPSFVSSLDEIILPEISQYDLKPEYTEDGESIYLGEGNYGYVVRAKLLQDDSDQNTDVAAKYFRPELNTQENVLTEARIQKYLEDTGAVPKVHGLVDLPHKDDLPVLVQECVGEGTTAEDMMKKGGSKLTWLKFCREAAKGLHKIHRKHVLVNDIKFDNILIEDKDGSLAVKFVDFGLASYKSSFVSGKPEAEMVDCPHIAPEVKKQGPSTILSDIFSLGFVIRHIGRKTKHSFVETMGKLLTPSDPSLRLPLKKFIAFVEAMVVQEEIKAATISDVGDKNYQ